MRLLHAAQCSHEICSVDVSAKKSCTAMHVCSTSASADPGGHAEQVDATVQCCVPCITMSIITLLVMLMHMQRVCKVLLLVEADMQT